MQSSRQVGFIGLC